MFVTVYLLTQKDEVYEKFKDFIIRTKNMFGSCLKELRCDNGSEYVNSRMKDLCHNFGIRMGVTTAYCPQMNGKAERKNNHQLLRRVQLLRRRVPCYWTLA